MEVLAIASDYEQCVVDADTDPDHRRELWSEVRDVQEVGEHEDE
jgi:hypothetical protein